ncbi:aldo/keto reductase [Paractinoplanes maris]|uniref:aldo/keto reductase n=1 Tax=Paractinoplanes maris TaxID=1734446 RepID=UPI00202098E1|nr:aldo/keto reductase [Actinoplanes maris]
MGSTGVYVSEVSLGAITFGGAGPAWEVVGGLPLAESERIVHAALDAGVNLIDTADVYGDGQSEEQLGVILQGRRDEVILSTKGHSRTGAGPNDVGQSRLHLMRSLEDSLRRLRTDHIDVYMLHNFDQLTSLEETLRTLDDAVRQGKVRYLAAANFSAWQVSKALGVSARLGLNGFVAVQSYYSLAGRDAEQELIPMVQDEKLALTVWAPLAGGLLTGKFGRDGVDATARRGRPETPNFPPVDYERVHDIVDVLRSVADRHGATVAQTSLAWLLAQPGVTSVTVSARRIDQLMDNLGAVDVTLTEEDLVELNQVSGNPPSYPTWVQDAFRAARYPR